MTRINRYSAVLFDYDGTLMDTDELVMASWQHTFREMTGHEGDQKRILHTFGEPLEVSMKAFFPDIDPETVLEAYRSFHYAHFEELIHLFPGVRDTLRRLRADGFQTGIVTSRLRHTTMLGLKKFHLEDAFDVIVTVDDCTQFKPDPAPALQAMQALNVQPEETAMVGDAKYDLLCAKRAGITYVQVGWADPAKLELEGAALDPDAVIRRHEDLLGILEGEQ